MKTEKRERPTGRGRREKLLLRLRPGYGLTEGYNLVTI